MEALGQDPAVRELQRQVAELSSIVKSPNQLSQYLDIKTKDIIKKGISDAIIDLVWDKYFYYYTPFESLTGWDLVDSSAGSSGVNDGGVILQTDATINHTSSIDKAPLNDTTLSFNSLSRFRTTATFINTASTQVVFTIGDSQGGAGKAYYGFEMQDGTLYGITGNGTTTSSVPLLTVTAPVVVQMDARLYPNNRVDFYATTTSTKPPLVGSITQSIPTGSIITNGAFWFFIQLATLANAAKQVAINSVEYIQERPNI